MKLNYIELHNIGLYKDEIISFQSNKKKDINFIWGNNGAGKTTFINSIKVGLLGSSSLSGSYSEYCDFVRTNMISSRVGDEASEASIKISIELKENNSRNEYLLERKWYFTASEFEEKTNIYQNNSLLDYERKEQIQNLISRNLPSSLLDVIVFDGESVITILSENKMDELIKGIVYSVFGMDIYAQLSKDLSSYLRSAKSDDSISAGEQVNLIKLENAYRSLLSKNNKITSLIAAEEANRIAISRKTKLLANKFTEKTGVSISDIDDIGDKLSDIENKKEKMDAEIKYINEEILPLKLVHARIRRILDRINNERPYLVLKSIEELRRYFSNSKEALELVSDLQKMIPENDIEIHYNLSESDYQTVVSINSILDRFHKDQLLSNLEGKNEFVQKLRDKLTTAGKIEEPESQSILAELEAAYTELEQSKQSLYMMNKESEENRSVLLDAKNEYESFKQILRKRKKDSTSYVNAMLYKDALDEFINENVVSICQELNHNVLNELRKIRFRNDSISKIEISSKNFEMKIYEKNGNLIPSNLFSAGEKQVLLGIVLKEALSIAQIDTFFLFDTPVGRLDSTNRRIFTNEVIFDVSDQVFVFATDTDFSKADYEAIQSQITSEKLLQRNQSDEIIMKSGGIY